MAVGCRSTHDHARPDYLTKVRGLLCARCNTYVGLVEAGTHASNEAVERYLANPWHKVYPPAPYKHQKQSAASNHALLIPRDLWDAAVDAGNLEAEKEKWLRKHVEAARSADALASQRLAEVLAMPDGKDLR